MQTNISQEDYQSLAVENQNLLSKIIELEQSKDSLQSRLDWLISQVFEKKSEKFYPDNGATPFPLFEQEELASDGKQPEIDIPAHKRKKRGKTKPLGDNTDSGLRFDDCVEIIVEDVYPEEIADLAPEEYEIIGKEISDRLASRVSKNFVHRRVFHKAKLKSSSEIVKSPVPAQVLERSYLSVSFLVDMLLDKCLYSLPLYRQHQRLKFDGFHLSRGMLTNNFINVCSPLSRIVDAQLFSVLLSRILAIDETPIKVGVNREKHKMKKGYIWPIYGEQNEIVYNYHQSRGAVVLKELLEDYQGTILSDGYSAYKSYVDGLKAAGLSESITQASCWVHARRTFVKLEKLRPVEYKQALKFIGALYKIESELDSKNASDIFSARQRRSLPVVDDYFNWLKSFSGKSVLATNKLLRQAINYSLEREESMRVFLKDPDLQLDTNHLEREIRPIAIGRKNWLFCWTEVGADSLCVAQSLIRTCLLQGINPREYLIDVLQRLALERHDDDDVSDLIPRLWKDTFADSSRLAPSQIVLDAVRT